MATSRIKGITVEIDGDTTGLSKALSSVNKEMKSTQSQLKDMEKLEEAARSAGETTKFSATEAAEAMSYMGLAGWSADEMCSGLSGVLNLAAASEMDLASASDIVTDYLSAFGLTAADSEIIEKWNLTQYDAVTNTDTIIAESSLPAVPFLVKVIISDLNYRNQPSMSGAVKGQTGIGTFTITEVSNGWGKLKSGVGWIYLLNTSYCTIGSTVSSSTTSSASEVPYMVKVTITDLNIRTGPGTNYSKTGKQTGKGTFTIVEETTGEGSTKGWGLLKAYQSTRKGWISLDYASSFKIGAINSSKSL